MKGNLVLSFISIISTTIALILGLDKFHDLIFKFNEVNKILFMYEVIQSLIFIFFIYFSHKTYAKKEDVEDNARKIDEKLKYMMSILEAIAISKGIKTND